MTQLGRTLDRASSAAGRAAIEIRAVNALVRAGAVGRQRPDRTLLTIKALLHFGPLGGAAKMAALRHGPYRAIVDERGDITYAEFDRQIDQLAQQFRRHLPSGATVGILCRNHRGPLLTAFAASRAGLTCVWLNTGFATPQAVDVMRREGVDFLVHDSEFGPVVDAAQPACGSLECDISQPSDDFSRWLSAGKTSAPPRPAKPGKIVLLTSGTTGTPKGAPRAEPRTLSLPGAVLERMPMRARDTTIVGPPVFHGTGLLITLISIALGSTVILRRNFDPEQFLADVDHYQVRSACVVPVMLQRIAALDDRTSGRYDVSSLEIVFTAGAQLHAQVAADTTRRFGEVLYNLYGSTECSVATIATPRDVREAPASVGRRALGARVEILGPDDNVLPTGQIGRIFVGSTMPFDGYTGGGSKDCVRGLLSSGDVGYFDDRGRLYISGRDDEMIVSGGENVFPREVEELLLRHPAIADATATGVADADFGQRLDAYVVLAPDTSLTADDVRAYVKSNLARYKVPREVYFVAEIPRNPSGKILKRLLSTLPTGPFN